jgi:hypothetical protein
MKVCPTCKRTYSDDTLSYCLADGSLLSAPFNSEASHPQIDPEATLVSAPFQTARPAAAKPNRAIYISIIILFGVVAVAGLIISLKSCTSRTTNTNQAASEASAKADRAALDQQKADLQNREAQLEKERQRIADERKKLDEQKANSTPVPQPSNQAPTFVVDESTERIKFHRGSVQEIISGDIKTARSYVLRARSGQYLAASINSPNGCVTFTNHSANTTSTTVAGDNSLALINNCSTQATFTLTIYVR